MNKNLIHNLRKAHYWVRVCHKRYDNNNLIGLATKKQIKEFYKTNPIVKEDYPPNNLIAPHGGLTTVEIVPPRPHPQIYFIAEAKCRRDEPFVRKLALQICLGRIQKQFRLNNLNHLIEELHVVQNIGERIK